MSSLYLSVSAFDVLDQIHYSVSCRELDPDAAEGKGWQMLASGTIQGTGETDHREWARDVLVACLEDL